MEVVVIQILVKQLCVVPDLLFLTSGERKDIPTLLSTTDMSDKGLSISIEEQYIIVFSSGPKMYVAVH